MPARVRDLTKENPFGRLYVNSIAGKQNGRLVWNCTCSCGNTKVILGESLTSGKTQSCGCYQKETSKKVNTKHRMIYSREYRQWSQMKTRCFNKKSKDFKYYGARGITVCDRWLHSFENFYEDMGPCPENYTLERKNNEGDYEPKNCRWASRSDQNQNTRVVRLLTFEGKTKSLSQWAKFLGIAPSTLHKRLKVGWSLERALTKGKN